MTWQSAYFVAGHAARIAGNATMTPAAASGFEAYYLRDGGAQALAKFGSSGANSRIDIDRGAGVIPTLDRLIIPSGHNLGAQTVTLYGSATGAFGGEETTLKSFTSAAGLINQTLSTPSALRYLRCVFAGTGQWQLGELWVGKTFTLASGAAPAWSDPYAPNLLTYVFDSGVTGAVELGPAVRGFEYSFVRLDASDVALMEELLEDIGRGLHTFWFMPPDTAETLRLVRLAQPAGREQGSANPRGPSGPVYSYSLSMIEDLS